MKRQEKPILREEKKTILLIFILCLFHLTINIIWFLNFEPALSLIYSNGKENPAYFNSGSLTFLPRISESLVISRYEISLFLLPLFKNLPGHFAFINTLLFLLLIITTFLLGKEIGNKKIGFISAFIISFYPSVYLLSRQTFLYFPLICTSALFVLCLLYSRFFSKFFFSLSAAGLAFAIKYVAPTTEAILWHLTLSGPLIYSVWGMVKTLKKYISAQKYRDTAKIIASFSLFSIIIFANYTTFHGFIFSDYVREEQKKFSSLYGWCQISPKNQKAEIFIKPQTKLFIHFSIKESKGNKNLSKIINHFNFPQIIRFCTEVMRSAAILDGSETYWKMMRTYFPQNINGQKLSAVSSGQDFFTNKKICGLELSLLYEEKSGALNRINIYANSPNSKNIGDRYNLLEKTGELKNEKFQNYKIKIKSYDIFNKPAIALSGYWFILATSLLRPFFFCIFCVFFILYLRKSFPGKWLLISWIFIPIFILTLVSKKIEWYIIATVPGFAIITGHYIVFFWEKLSGNKLKNAITLTAVFILSFDFLYLSFLPENLPFKTSYLINNMRNKEILKTFDSFINYKATYNQKGKNLKCQQIITEIKDKKNIQKINIYNDYELFKQLSFYTLREDILKVAFYFINNKNKKSDYEIIYKSEG